jgi:hypothetical protein
LFVHTEVISAPTKSVTRWSVQEVQQWLDSAGFTIYTKNFKDQDIDGNALDELYRMKVTKIELFFGWLREFGMAKVGHQLRFSSSLRQLFEVVDAT